MSMFCYQCEMSSQDGCGSNGRQIVGVCGKDANLARLQDILVFGVKGLAAYREHAAELGANTAEIDNAIAESMSFTLTNVNFNFEQHIAQLMKLGKAGIAGLSALSNAHTQTLGIPAPVTVSQNRAEGKAILVSGHNLKVLRCLLEQTQNRGVNVYTHSEMLPAHGYPELRKFPHLRGNIGKSWFDQAELFNKWSGAILVTTNCIVPLHEKANYGERIFGYKIVGVEGIRTLTGDDFTPVIEKALASPPVDNFTDDSTVTTGHHYKAILELAPMILDAVNSGKIKRFFVIAGCDSPTKERNYFRKLAQRLPHDCVIMTSSCGKFRFNDIEFGTVPGTDIPRYLDLGQCNDSNGAVEIALALSQATGIAINDLPISVVLMWMEQKAVIILLALLSLGIQSMYIGPKRPQFINHDILNFLVGQFDIRLAGDVDTDLASMLGQGVRYR